MGTYRRGYAANQLTSFHDLVGRQVVDYLHIDEKHTALIVDGPDAEGSNKNERLSFVLISAEHNELNIGSPLAIPCSEWSDYLLKSLLRTGIITQDDVDCALAEKKRQERRIAKSIKESEERRASRRANGKVRQSEREAALAAAKK